MCSIYTVPGFLDGRTSILVTKVFEIAKFTELKTHIIRIRIHYEPSSTLRNSTITTHFLFSEQSVSVPELYVQDHVITVLWYGCTYTAVLLQH